MKIAFIHDHLTQIGGAEQVLRSLQKIWPNAPTYTLIYDEAKVGSMFLPESIRTSWLQKIPGAKRHYQWFLPFMPLAHESYDLSDFDVILSSSSAFSKGVIVSPKTLHLCYCHTPTRYLWSDSYSYVEDLRYARFIKKIIPFFLYRLRQWDYLAAQRVDAFIANSANVAARIQKYYRRDSTVIFPPVNLERFSASPQIGDYFLTGGRLVAYKKFDLVIRAFNRLGLKLKIFGTGPAETILKTLAKPNVEFLGYVDSEKLNQLYQQAVAFIHPQIEDFGITAIEAMAAGRPVIAFRAGGAVETIKEGVTGLFFEEQTWENLTSVVVRFKPENFSSQTIIEHAKNFDFVHFQTHLKNFVETSWQKFSKTGRI